MSILRKLSVIVVGATLVVTGCGKDKDTQKDNGKAGGDPVVVAKPSAPPAAAAWVAVPNFGLQLEAPADAVVDVGATEFSLELVAESDFNCRIFLRKENPELAYTYDQTLGHIKEARMGNKKLKAMKKEEQGADGTWKLEWESEGAMDPNDTVYGVDYRVIIDGTSYGCSHRSSTPGGQACVAKACGSLKKI